MGADVRCRSGSGSSRVHWAGIWLLIAGCLLLNARWAGAVGEGLVYQNLDQAVDQAAAHLTLHGNLKGQGLLVSPGDFYELPSELSLPLALALREKMVAAFSPLGVRVLSTGGDEDRVNILRGQWQSEGEALSISFKVMTLAKEGAQAVASYTVKVDYRAIAPELLRPNIESWGRYLVRKLEEKAHDDQHRTVYLRPLEIKGVARPRDLGEYLVNMLRTALTESRLFQPMDAPMSLAQLDAAQLRTRSIKIHKSPPTAEGAAAPAAKDVNAGAGAGGGMSLTGDLLQADSEVVGKAYLNDAIIEIQMYLRDQQGRQLSAATAKIGTSLFPPELVELPPPPPPPAERKDAYGGAAGVTGVGTGFNTGSGFDTGTGFDTGSGMGIDAGSGSGPGADDTAGSGVSVRGLLLELSSTRGEGRARYRGGEKMQFIARTSRNASFYLFTRTASGEAMLLYPIPGVRGRAVEANSALILPDDGLPYELIACPPYGEEYLWAVASETPMDFPLDLSGDWGSFHTLQERLRAKGLQQGDGYAEAELVLVTEGDGNAPPPRACGE